MFSLSALPAVIQGIGMFFLPLSPRYLMLKKKEFCCLLLIFANSLDPDQARHVVGPDLDPNCLTLL